MMDGHLRFNPPDPFGCSPPPPPPAAASAARRGCNIQPSLGETSPSLDLKVILGFKIS